MDEPTRGEALGKLDSLEGMVAHPEMWPVFDPPPSEGTWLDQNLASALTWSSRLPARLHEPVDRTSWVISPIEVNAYYLPQRKQVALSAAIFQLPFFALRWDPAARYGAIGAVMGHELTHGFDDSGRHFDGTGRLRDWRSPAVATIVSYAQMYCEKLRPELEALRLKTDPHAPGKGRVNGPLSNIPEFAAAFHCPAAAPMRAPLACEVW